MAAGPGSLIMIADSHCTQPALALPGAEWLSVPDGNASARALYARHYSYRRRRDGVTPLLFVGPGWKLILLHATGKALLVWRKFRSMDAQMVYRPCIEGCGRLADMPRNPVWCAECNAERIDRITRSFEELAAGFAKIVEMPYQGEEERVH